VEENNNTNIKSLLEISDKLIEHYEREKKEYEHEAETWWKSLTYEEKCLAFYNIIKRMHKAEVEDQGSYRYALYDIFDFGPDMYGIGMQAGYMELHNLLCKAQEKQIDWNILIKQAIESKDEIIMESALRKIRDELGPESNEYITLYNSMNDK
jgi:hypothetical protein